MNATDSITDKELFLEEPADDNVTLTLDDIEHTLLVHSVGNGNVPHTPESTMMTLAGILQKEYTMRKIMPLEVAKAHRNGDIHLHNADMPTRAYSLQFSEVVRIGNSIWPIGMLFDSQKEIEVQPDMDSAYDLNGKYVEDIGGPTKISRFLKHKTDKNMLYIYLKNGKSIICTEDHPFQVGDSLIQAKDLKEGMVLPVKNAQKEDWMFKVNNVNGIELTKEFGWVIGMFITDGYYSRGFNEGTIGYELGIFQKSKETSDLIVSRMNQIGMNANIYEKDYGYLIRVYSKEWVELFNSTLHIGKGSKRKCLPPNTLQYNEDFVRGLISGIVDGDGCVLPDEYGTTVNIGVASHGMVSQIQYILDVLGIPSHCHMQFEEGKIQIANIHGQERIMKQNMPVYRLTFRLSEEARTLMKYSEKVKSKANNKVSITREIPNQGEIVQIRPHPKIDDYVYDFTTESHFFMVNGVRVHNCSGHSPAYVAKYGLSLPNLNSMAKPAKHADVFIEQLIKFAASMQGHFSGAIGFDAVNTFVAPYLVGLSDEKVMQCAQILVYEFAQQAVARGGQVIFSDLNLYWGIPKHYQEVDAIGPSGKNTGLPYKEYDEESKRFMRALMQVYNEGDGQGRPFFFPKADCHITAESVDDEEYMNMLGSVASKMGSPYFIFDRGTDPSIAQCCFDENTIVYYSIDGVKKVGKFKNMPTTYNSLKTKYNGEWKDAKLVITPRANKEMYRIVAENNAEITVTEDHLICTSHGEVRADDLSIDDMLMFATDKPYTGEVKTIKSIERLTNYSEDTVYCFEMVDKEHPYFELPNKMVVHNCRLKISLTKNDVSELKTPWKARFSALQNVTMNLPAFAYQAKGDETKFNEILFNNMMLAKDAHQAKFDFIERTLAMGLEGPLGLLTMDHDGEPYLRFEKVKFLIGMVGLNEAVQVMCGEQMHESKAAYLLGMKMIAEMNKNCKTVTDELGMTTILEQTPAESTAYRFAKLDARRYGDGMKNFQRGTIEAPYYTNSTYLNIGANIDPIERVRMEGKMHPLIDAGSMTHVWLGNHTPDPSSVASFVRKTFYNTQNAQIAFSPEFTTCGTCGMLTKGLLNTCPKCGSENVRGITRVTGYYSFTDSWNKGKRQELIDRARTTL